MALVAQGTNLQYDSGGSNWLTLIELMSIDGPNESGEDIDTTALDSGTHRTFLAGLIDGGEVACAGNYLTPGNTGRDWLKSNLGGDAQDFRIVDVSGGSIEFSAYVRDLGRNFTSGAKAEASFTLKVTGNVVEVEAA